MTASRWWELLAGDPAALLLSDSDPGATWVALTEVLGRPCSAPAVERARLASRNMGPAATILGGQEADGWWGSPLAYGARWGGSAWRLIAAAACGADPGDPRAVRGAEALLQVVQPSSGGFATGRSRPPASCFTAELCWALLHFGFGHHARVREALQWLAERSGPGSGWSCPELRHLTHGGCAVTAVGALLLFGGLPGHEKRQLRSLATRGGEWLAQHALFLDGPAPRGWLRFGHPNLSRTDLVEALYALARAGADLTPSIAAAVRQVLGRQRPEGGWEAAVVGPYLPADGAAAGRWVTLRAVVAVAAFGGRPHEEPECER